MRRVITRSVENGQEIHRSEETTHFVHDRYRGPWSGFMMISREGWGELEERLSDRTLGMQAVRVLLAAVGSADRSNRVRAGRKDIARKLAMHEADVGKALRALVGCGFLELPKLKFDPYTVSPRFAWNSSKDKLCDALKSRGMLDDKGMMAARAA